MKGNDDMGSFVLEEIKKLTRSSSMWITLALLIGIVVLDGFFAIQQYNEELAATLSIPKDEVGYYTEDPWIGVATLYNSWIGGRPSGVFPLLFYFLMPAYCVIPFAWSYLSEKKSGYIKLICCKIGKSAYFTAKYISGFISGFLVVVIPQLLSLLLVSCFVPAYMPDMNYELYYQVDMTKMLGDLYYTLPGLYVALYVLTSGLFGGVWATIPIAVSMFTNNKFSALFAPYIVLLFIINTAERALVLREYFTVSPLNFIRPTMQGQEEHGWIFGVELLLLAAGSFLIVLLRGRKNDVF